MAHITTSFGMTKHLRCGEDGCHNNVFFVRFAYLDADSGGNSKIPVVLCTCKSCHSIKMLGCEVHLDEHDTLLIDEDSYDY